MIKEMIGGEQRSILRVDGFIVPATARAQFLERLMTIKSFLSSQPGCLYNRVAESNAGDGATRMITIVEWQDQTVFERAKSEAAAFYAQSGFSPATFMEQMGIKPDFAVYRDLSECVNSKSIERVPRAGSPGIRR